MSSHALPSRSSSFTMIVRESFGEDIAGTDTERSNDEDEYEGSFIDDDDPELFSPSPSPSLNDAGTSPFTCFFFIYTQL